MSASQKEQKCRTNRVPAIVCSAVDCFAEAYTGQTDVNYEAIRGDDPTVVNGMGVFQELPEMVNQGKAQWWLKFRK